MDPEVIGSHDSLLRSMNFLHISTLFTCVQLCATLWTTDTQGFDLIQGCQDTIAIGEICLCRRQIYQPCGDHGAVFI